MKIPYGLHLTEKDGTLGNLLLKMCREIDDAHVLRDEVIKVLSVPGPGISVKKRKKTINKLNDAKSKNEITFIVWNSIAAADGHAVAK
jgi:hypothetical protein